MPPATKKELAALQKQVDELRKWFDDEKKVVHAELDGWASLSTS
jgi:hypothetical protein